MKKLFLSLFLGMVLGTPLFGYVNKVCLCIGFSTNAGTRPQFSRELSSDGQFFLMQLKGYSCFCVRCYNASQKQKAETDLKEIVNALIQAGHANCLFIMNAKASGANKYIYYLDDKPDNFSSSVGVAISINNNKISLIGLANDKYRP